MKKSDAFEKNQEFQNIKNVMRKILVTRKDEMERREKASVANRDKSKAKTQSGLIPPAH